MTLSLNDYEGILLVDKPIGVTAFDLVRALRRLTHIKKIGHAGTLDPFATGVMVLLIGRAFTRLSDKMLSQEKQYIGTITLGMATDTFDCDGVILKESSHIPTEEDVRQVLSNFQGEILQTPPMYSAKKVKGKKLYELARQGKTIEREPVRLQVATTLVSYEYPKIVIDVTCSKGTYIRSLANDIGEQLGCGGHLSSLRRIRSGTFTIDRCFDGSQLFSPDCDMSALRSAIFIPK